MATIQLFIVRSIWNLFLHFSWLHTRLGQSIERAYLRVALPNVMAFEVEELPGTGFDVPLDELVEVGPVAPKRNEIVLHSLASGQYDLKYRSDCGCTDVIGRFVVEGDGSVQSVKLVPDEPDDELPSGIGAATEPPEMEPASWNGIPFPTAVRAVTCNSPEDVLRHFGAECSNCHKPARFDGGDKCQDCHFESVKGVGT